MDNEEKINTMKEVEIAVQLGDEKEKEEEKGTREKNSEQIKNNQHIFIRCANYVIFKKVVHFKKSACHKIFKYYTKA